MPKRFLAKMHYSSVGDMPFPTFGEGFLVLADSIFFLYFFKCFGLRRGILGRIFLIFGQKLRPFWEDLAFFGQQT